MRFAYVAAVTICVFSAQILFTASTADAALSCPAMFASLFGKKKEAPPYAGLTLTAREPISELPPFTVKHDPSRQTGIEKVAYGPSSRVWQAYSNEFQLLARRNILNSRETYIEAIRNGHPHIDFLKQLGYRFEIVGNTLKVEVPTIEAIYEAYEKIMRGHVATGRIRAEEVAMPARAFDHDGKVIFLKFGEQIPRGAKPYKKLLSNEDFARAHQERVILLGEISGDDLANPLHSAFEHDLGHLSAYAAFPEYQTAISQFNAAIGPDTPEKFSRRAVYLNESMEAVGVSNRSSLIEIFKRHDVYTRAMRNGDPSTVADYASRIGKMKDAELDSLLREIETKRYDLIEKVGGAQRDILDRRFNLNLVAGIKMPGYTVTEVDQRRRNVFLSGPDGLIDLIKLEPDQRRAHAARLLAFLDNTSLFQIEDIVRQATHDKIDPKSPLYYLFCVNVIVTAHAFCQ